MSPEAVPSVTRRRITNSNVPLQGAWHGDPLSIIPLDLVQCQGHIRSSQGYSQTPSLAWDSIASSSIWHQTAADACGFVVQSKGDQVPWRFKDWNLFTQPRRPSSHREQCTLPSCVGTRVMRSVVGRHLRSGSVMHARASYPEDQLNRVPVFIMQACLPH